MQLDNFIFNKKRDRVKDGRHTHLLNTRKTNMFIPHFMWCNYLGILLSITNKVIFNLTNVLNDCFF